MLTPDLISKYAYMRTMDLSEIEWHFLHEFEESDKDLYLLETDVRLLFSQDGNDDAAVRNLVKNTIRQLYTKKLIELFEYCYRETKPDHFEIETANKLSQECVERVLNESNSWDQEYLFRQAQRYYFMPTDLGIELLDSRMR